MSRRVDQVKVVDLSVACLVFQRGGLCLDRDAALAFDIHRVEHLRFHFAVGQPSAQLDNAVGQSGFAVIYVGDNRKISDKLH